MTFLLALLLLVAWLSVAQVFGVPYRYVAAVLMPLSMMMWLPLFGVVTPAIRRSRGLLGALIACAMVVALASTLDAAHPDRGVVATGVEIDRASDLIIRALGDSSTPVLVDFDNSFDAAPYQPGLIAELRNRGVRAVGPQRFGFYLGAAVTDQGDARSTVILVSDSDPSGIKACFRQRGKKPIWRSAGDPQTARSMSLGRQGGPPIEAVDSLSGRRPDAAQQPQIAVFLIDTRTYRKCMTADLPGSN
ncbi:MAG: hypothetical protein KDA37_10000 [Planctomycetales bacterium]|nr:hypothetical protein [Planctomycetales bacterium]